jgi:D-lactate dehydrogenase
MIGGILSNNSSGMCCGVALNSYHTSKYIRFILPGGQAFSTENKEDYIRFEKECAGIYQSINSLRQQITGNLLLADRIRKKYLTKNTVGYSLNSFIDYSHPLDILAHLLVGAEGTLAFISEAVMQTVPDYPCKATALIYFENIFAACRAITPLRDAGAEAVELMDRAALRSIENIPGVPERLRTLPISAAALLVEFQDYNFENVDKKINTFLSNTASLSLLSAIEFTKDPYEQAFLWKLRKGMFPAVGAVRASGTTVVLEDIAFPVEQLGNAILDLQLLFAKFSYDNAIIFGHAKDGNIHFVITQSFNSATEVERYDLFMQDVVNLVIKKYDGTLKAEHGTGRNMAPFVETEWGSEAYEIMKTLKAVIDPENLLNPGVIINENKKAHLQHLKPLPVVEEEVDKCIECGYCEHKCPSRDITMTPRQRIVVRRELALLKEKGDTATYKRLVKQYQYPGLDTCAVDGLCATACPVDINTGDLVKRLRKENHTGFGNSIAVFIAKNFKATAFIVDMALKAGVGMNKIFGKRTMKRFTGGIKKIIPSFPLWSNQLHAGRGISKQYKRAASKQVATQSTVVYFPACVSRVMGDAGNKKSLQETFLDISIKAGIHVVLPKNINGLCCGQLFSSKGFTKAYTYKSNQTIDQLWEITQQGSFPVVLDVTSCSYTLQQCSHVLSTKNKERMMKMKILDSIDYIHDYIVPAVSMVIKKKSIVLHPVCSLQKMALQKRFITIANHFAEKVNVPIHAGCCGMAGDRGFLFPELTASATYAESQEVQQINAEGYYSSAKTCEMALSDATNKNYESILFLVNECLSS